MKFRCLDSFGLMRVTTTTKVATTTTCVTSVTCYTTNTPSVPTGSSATQSKCGDSSYTGPTLLSASLGQHAQHRTPTAPSVCEVIEQISRSLMLSPTIWFIYIDDDSLQWINVMRQAILRCNLRRTRLVIYCQRIWGRQANSQSSTGNRVSTEVVGLAGRVYLWWMVSVTAAGSNRSFKDWRS